MHSIYTRSGLIYENANIHIWMKCTDVDVFLAGRGGPNSLLWQYLALPSGDENYFLTPRSWCGLAGRTTNPNLMLAQEANYQRQPVSVVIQDGVEALLSQTSFWQLSHLTNSQTVPVQDCLWWRRCGGSNIGSNVFLAGGDCCVLGRESEAGSPPAGWEVDRRLRLNWIMNPPKERTRTNAQNIDVHQLSWRATWATDNILLLDHFFCHSPKLFINSNGSVNLLSPSHTWAFTSSLAAAKIHWI